MRYQICVATFDDPVRILIEKTGNFSIDSLMGIRSGGELGNQATVSKSKCPTPWYSLIAFARVDLPAPEFPNINVFDKTSTPIEPQATKIDLTLLLLPIVG